MSLNNVNKIISWNVNGIRSKIINDKTTTKKDVKINIEDDSNLSLMISKYNPNIVCLQETRCPNDIWERIEFNNYPYSYINVSTNTARGRGQGYSGTGVISKIEPLNVIYGLDTLEKPNDEGRVITLEFEQYYLINVYTPNSGTNEDYRINYWDMAMLKHIKNLEKHKPVVFTGDMNVCHTELDLYKKMPKPSERITGLLPEERMNFTQYINIHMIDTFRYVKSDNRKYSWWSPLRKSNRDKNNGWRIDYFLCSQILKDKILEADILNDVYGSDHCPILFTLNV